MEKVMIVDDTAYMRMVLRKILEEAGYEIVAEGENGKEGVQKYKEHKPDIVTMDLTMPKMDGIEAIKRILEIDPNAKVLVVSAIGTEQNVMKAIENGAKDFIKKPFEPDRVIKTLKGLN
ncbi:MAG: response regulator [Fusobacteriota bacterium]